jgi:hypothetical protein
MHFVKEKHFGASGMNVYVVTQFPTLQTECVCVNSGGDQKKWTQLRDFPESVVDQMVQLETRVCQDLFPDRSFAWPWNPNTGIRAKIPTRYSHIIIPMTDSENRRITFASLCPGARLSVDLIPTSVWEQDGQCGIAWTLKRIELKNNELF